MEIIFYGLFILILLAASLAAMYRLESDYEHDKYQEILNEAATLAASDTVEMIFDTKHRDER